MTKSAHRHSVTVDSDATRDMTFNKTGLSVGLVAGTEKTEIFGNSFYRTPTADTKYRISTGNATNKEKQMSFVEKESRRLSFIPGPKYL